MFNIFAFRATATNKVCVLAAAPNQKEELDSEYECDMDDYHPVQPLVHDHGISFVCLSSPHTKIDQHVIEVNNSLKKITSFSI